MSHMYATRHTQVELDQNRTISTESIFVFGFTVQGDGVADEVTLEDVDGNAYMKIHYRVSGRSIVSEQRWLASNGLVIRPSTPSANNFITVFHSQGGV